MSLMLKYTESSIYKARRVHRTRNTPAHARVADRKATHWNKEELAQ